MKAPWNLGLEWRGDWNGFYGVGRYNQLNAWRLDHSARPAAEALGGMRINLVIHNRRPGQRRGPTTSGRTAHTTACMVAASRAAP